MNSSHFNISEIVVHDGRRTTICEILFTNKKCSSSLQLSRHCSTEASSEVEVNAEEFPVDLEADGSSREQEEE